MILSSLCIAVESAKYARGLALEDIITELHLFVMRRKFLLLSSSSQVIDMYSKQLSCLCRS